MRYVTQVDIASPRASVIALIDDVEKYGQWQESLVNVEHLEGEPGQVGTRTRLHHKMGKREITMVETVTRREMPDVFAATYEAKGVWNQAINHFAELQGDRTRWTMETEFRCKGLMWFMTKLMPGMFSKQTQATMDAFKVFVEKQKA